MAKWNPPFKPAKVLHAQANAQQRPKTHTVFYWSASAHGEPIDKNVFHYTPIVKTYRNFETEFEARMFAAAFSKIGAEYKYCAMPPHGEVLFTMPNNPIKPLGRR